MKYCWVFSTEGTRSHLVLGTLVQVLDTMKRPDDLGFVPFTMVWYRLEDSSDHESFNAYSEKSGSIRLDTIAGISELSDACVMDIVQARGLND